MKVIKKVITVLEVCLLLFSIFTVITSWNPTLTAQSSNGAELTGNILDSGIDTDGDGKYNYLEIDVEINVFSGGNYRVEVGYLLDPTNSSREVWRGFGAYLNEGIQLLNLSFYGPEMYASKFNVSALGEVRLISEEYWDIVDYLEYVPLSHVYNYTEFDCAAVLTGKVYDKGIDTDGDGLFNKLQIEVEVNVTDAAEYRVQVSNLYGNTYVYVYNYSRGFLYEGVRILNVSLGGAKIYASHGNFSAIETISLYIYEDYHSYELQSMSYCPLNRTYSYYEFDPLAFFTGKVLDVGVDEDLDGLFDYLRISVEVNVTDAGYYGIKLEDLADNYSNYLYEYQSQYGEFEVGLHLINFTIYGPKIYAAHIAPAFIGWLCLEYRYKVYEWNWEWIRLDERNMVPLPTLYGYIKFEAHASLTGKVYDRGVDTDSDGLFDYLEVSVEVNVTEAGIYRISIGGLAGGFQKDNETVYERLYCSQYLTENLTLGIHLINFTFPGSMIAYQHFNPENVTDLKLAELNPYCQLSYISTVPLSRRYNYTQFNSPMNDMQIEFTVYPDSTVEVNGLFNHTRIYPPNYYQPLVNATLDLSTSEDQTIGSINGTILSPRYSRYPYYYPYRYMYPYSWDQFPYNSTTISFTSEYQNDMLNTQLNATVTMPPAGSTTYPLNSSDFSLTATYSDRMINVDLSGETELPTYYASQFPFNITDVSVLADYRNNEITGNITFHTISGFPLGDVIVYFSGNKTEISFTGYINVIYGVYYGTTINETILENMLLECNNTIPGRGEDSLYNVTNGMIECTQLNTTKTPITIGSQEGARVDYNATINGNFTEILAIYLTQMLFRYNAPEEKYSTVYAALDAALSSVDHASLTLEYYHSSKIASIDLTLSSDVKALWSNALQLVPQTVPTEYMTQSEAWLKIANATAYGIKNAYITATYSRVNQLLNVQASLTANLTQLENETLQNLPDILSNTLTPEYWNLVESCINTTYSKLESLNLTCNYIYGVTNFDVNWLLKGDINVEIDHVKSCYLEYLKMASPWVINWQLRVLNETQIDVSNFKLDIRQGLDWTLLKFSGLKLHLLEGEKIDSIRFKLYKFFNVTSIPYESPREFEKLKIIIMGGSNATHTVLLQASTDTPPPNMTSLDGKMMTWENVTISSLKNMLFKVAYQETINYLRETYYVPIFTNSTVSNFNFDSNSKRISFNVTGTSGTGFCNITIPKRVLYAAPKEWIVKIDGIPVKFNVTENDEYAFIYVSYPHSSHLIEIQGTWIVTEFPNIMLILILAILSLMMTIIVVIKQRKNLKKLETKIQNAINLFVSKL